jgi:hypothetical protein
MRKSAWQLCYAGFHYILVDLGFLNCLSGIKSIDKSLRDLGFLHIAAGSEPLLARKFSVNSRSMAASISFSRHAFFAVAMKP